MEIVEQLLGTYTPLCCLSIPVLVFFALAAMLPVAFFSLTGQQAPKESKEKKE